MILNGRETFRGLREEITDALFVEDAVASIIEIVEKNSPGRYLLQSGKNNQWEQCAAFLGIGNTFPTKVQKSWLTMK